MTRKLVVLDYGSGNLRSAQRALERVGAHVDVTMGHHVPDTVRALWRVIRLDTTSGGA